jgi:hypothetical protein
MPQQQTPAASLQPNDNSRLRSRVIPRGMEEEGTASGGGTGLMIGNDKQRELEIKKAKQLEYKQQLDFQKQQYPSPSKQRRGQLQPEKEKGDDDAYHLLLEERKYSSQQHQPQHQQKYPPSRQYDQQLQYPASPSPAVSNYDRSLPSQSSYLPSSASASSPSKQGGGGGGGGDGMRKEKITNVNNESEESRNVKKIEQEKYRKFLDVQVKQKEIEKEMEKMEKHRPPRGGYEEELGRESIKQPLTGRRGEEAVEKSNGYVQSVQRRENERQQHSGDYEYPVPSSSSSAHHHREDGDDRNRLFEARNPHLGSILEEDRDRDRGRERDEPLVVDSHYPSSKPQQQYQQPHFPYQENSGPMLSPSSTLQPQYPSPRAIARSQLVKDIYGKNNMFDAEDDGPMMSQFAGRAGKGERKHGMGDEAMGRESSDGVGYGGEGSEGTEGGPTGAGAEVGGPGTNNWKPSGKNYKSERTKDSILSQKAALDAQRADIESRKQQEKEKERIENEKFESRVREENERQAAMMADEKDKKRRMLEEQNKNLSDLQLKSEQEALARKNRHSSQQQQPQQQQQQQQHPQHHQPASPPRNKQSKISSDSPSHQQQRQPYGGYEDGDRESERGYEEDYQFPTRPQQQQQQQQEHHYSSSRKPPPAVNPASSSSSHLYENIRSPLKEEVFKQQQQQQLLQMQQPPVAQKGKVESKWKNEELTSALRQKWSDKPAPNRDEREYNDYDDPYERGSYDATSGREEGGVSGGGGGMISASYKPRAAGVPPLISKNGELQAYPHHDGYSAAGSQQRLATPDSIDHFVSNFSARGGEVSTGIAGGGGGRIFLPSAGDNNTGRPPSSSSAAAKQFRSKIGGNHSNAMQETLFQQQQQQQQQRQGQNRRGPSAYDEEGDVDLSKVSESKLVLSNPWNSEILSSLGRDDEVVADTEERSEIGVETAPGRKHFAVKPSLSSLEPQSVSRPSTRNRKEKSKNQLEESLASNSYFVNFK